MSVEGYESVDCSVDTLTVDIIHISQRRQQVKSFYIRRIYSQSSKGNDDSGILAGLALAQLRRTFSLDDLRYALVISGRVYLICPSCS